MKTVINLSVRALFIALAVFIAALSVSCQNDPVTPPPIDGGDCDENGGDCGNPNDGPIFIGAPPVIINEVNPINSTYTDEFGGTPGWVEFYNPADTAVDLSGYALTNSLNRRIWTFGNVTVGPQSYILVFLSGRNVPDFDSPGDNLDLLESSIGAWNWSDDRSTPPGGSTASHQYVAGESIGGTLVSVNNAPAFAWSSAVVMLVLEDWDTTEVVDLSRASQIHFRGFVSQGSRLEIRLAQSGMNDWETWPAVITGTGEENGRYTINLPTNDPVYPNLKKIYGLRFANPPEFRGRIEFSFNSITAPRRAGDLHASFQLSVGGGRLFLMDQNNNIRDSIAYPATVRGLSHAQKADGAWALSAPTPGAANDGEFFDGQMPQVPAGSLPESGFYENELAFTVPAGTGESVICCDTTGRQPTQNSAIRSGAALTIRATTIMLCAQFKAGSFASEPVMRTYILGRERPSLPVVSIAVDPTDMFHYTAGIYSRGPNASSEMPYYGANFWQDIELPIRIDFFENGARHAWSQGAGISIFGGWSRMHPKKSVQISFRDQYGANRLNYGLFPEFPRLTRFKHFILRNNGNNYGLDYIRDVLMTSLTEGLNIEYQKGRPAIVFYNGYYYGIHDIRERSNSDYFETNFGIEDDFIDLVKGDGSASSGSDADYQDIMRWLEGVSLEDDDNLRILNERIDVDNYTSYIQSEIFFVNTDWPGNNLKRWRDNSALTRWRWFLYDTDFGFDYRWNENRNVNMFEFVTDANGPDWPNPPKSTFLTRKLFENAGYKHAFANRFSLLLATYFTPARINARVDELMAPIISEIPLDQQRWGHNASTMNQELSTIRAFGNTRGARVQRELEAFFDLSGAADLTLTVSGNGKIFVHDLEVPNGRATFRAYASAPIILKAEPTGGAAFQRWSDGVTEAERTVTVNGATTLEAVFGGFNP